MRLWRYILCWAFLVAVFSAGLWFGVLHLKGEMRHQERLARLHGYRLEIEAMVAHRGKVLRRLSVDPLVLTALVGAGGAEVEPMFDVLARTEDVAIVYLLNSEGRVVASSAYDGGQRLTGRNYRFRPYFKYAMTGRPMVFPAVGITTRRPGVYMSLPVWNQGMDPAGVLVFKLSMASVDALFHAASSPVVLADTFGVVFAGNTRRWLYHVIGNTVEAVTAGVDLQRQFGGHALKNLGWTAADKEVVVENIRYGVVSVKIPAYRWLLVGLFSGEAYPAFSPGQRVMTQLGYLAGLLLITLVMILLGSVSRRRQAERILIKHRETLENVVNRRTRQLEAMNDTLVRELEERRFAEKRLRENETSFKRANRIAGLGSWEWVLSEDKVFLSEVMMAIYDSDSDSLEGRFEEVINRMVHPEDRERVVRAGRMLVETGRGEPVEYRIVRGDGAIRWMRAEVPEVKEFSRSGEVVSLIGTVQDITERKLNENSLLRLKAAMEQSVDGIAVADLDGVVAFLNPAWATMHGYRAEELVGASLETFHTRAQIEGPLRDFLNKVTGDGSCEGEIGHVARDGREFPTWMSSSLMADHGGNPMGIVWICRDISTQKQAEASLKRAKEEAEAATRAKSAFLANMSHEIRTPMNGVIGMIDILLDTGLSHEQRDFAESVKSSADALLTLINDILDFSKIEAGKLDIEAIPFNLRTELEGLSDVMAIKAGEKGLAFRCLIQDNVPVHLNGDPVRLRQILTNLVGNAIKFVETGSVMIRVALKEAVDSRVRLFFEVVDTGIGIPEASLERIFESFSQGDVSTTRKYGGTGLGLSISEQLTHLMKGKIGVESCLGRGTTFWFTAEFEVETQKAAGARSPRLDGDQGRGKTEKRGGAKTCLHVLLAEDNRMNQRVAVNMLERLGHTVRVVNNGIEALSVFACEAFDLVLMDGQMPEMDGLTAATEIRRMETEAPETLAQTLAHVPIIAVTANAMAGDRERFLGAGMDEYITKPMKKNELEGVIGRVMGEG